eukprot:1169007-Pleurochrysis_carterae.AAC.4
MRRTGCRPRRGYSPNPRWNGACSGPSVAEADVAETKSGTAVVVTGGATELASTVFVGVGEIGAAEANTRASRKFRSGGYAAV